MTEQQNKCAHSADMARPESVLRLQRELISSRNEQYIVLHFFNEDQVNIFVFMKGLKVK